MKTLIVDDEPHILRDLGAALREEGCEVHTASSGEVARKLIANSSFDYAVIDLNLDVASGFGGIDIFKLARNSAIKSIILSAYSLEQVDEQLKQQSKREEAEQTMKEIRDSYIYKGEEGSYIEAVFEKLGIVDTSSECYGNYHALVIAIQNYDCADIGKLKYPIRDANKIYKLLTDQYSFDEERIKLMLDSSRQEIISELYQLGSTLNSDNNLLIFYAGHGHLDGRREQGYWLPRDALATNPANWISNGDIRDFIRGIKTQHTLLISDACFSGTMLQTPRSASFYSKTIQEKYRTPSRRVIASGSPKQTVPDESVFLNHLIRLLKDSPAQHLYAEKLYVDVCNEFVSDNLSVQNPVYGSIHHTGDEIGGDFIFIRK